MSDMDIRFNETVKKGLPSMSSPWIEQAVCQKHPRMTLDLAHSVPLVYDEWEKILYPREILN